MHAFCYQAKFIAECIDEIKQELKQDIVSIKANAVNKLVYVSCLLLWWWLLLLLLDVF